MSEQTIREGKYVALTYRIADETGTVLEQSDLPMGFVLGGHQELIGGMDAAIQGKHPGDDVDFELAPGEAFGDHDPSLTFTDDIAHVPPQFRQIGAEVQMQNEAGEVKTFYVTRIENGRLTVDGNHPLAGKELIYELEILEARPATAEERILLRPCEGES